MPYNSDTVKGGRGLTIMALCQEGGGHIEKREPPHKGTLSEGHTEKWCKAPQLS